MSSEQEYEGTETNPQDGSASSPQHQPHPEGSEAAYERLTAYAFARRYVAGKAVADVVLGHQEEGAARAGSLLLARSAESVEVLLGNGSPATMDPASGTPPAPPNIVYRRVELPALPYPEGYFDVVVAFGVVHEMQRPEELLREAKRVLKDEGVLLLSLPDKQAEANQGREGMVGGRRGMYVGELREILGRHFKVVRLFRHGAVVGGFIFPDTKEGTSSEEGAPLSEAPPEVEVVRFSLAETTRARLEAQPPTTRSVIAVCCDEARILGQDEQPYVLLDRESGVFEEREDLVANVELMLAEIEQMQETEVQAFLGAVRVQRQQNLAELQRHYLSHIRSFLGHRRNAAREDTLHLRNVILEVILHRRNVAREDAFHLWNLIRAIILHRRNIIYGNILHRRNVILGNARHQRNLVLEKILHRRNIIYGNILALRKKGLKGSLRGALRRLTALYRRLAAKKPD